MPVLSYSSEIAVTRAAAPLRTTESWTSSGEQFVATLNDASGIEGNIWAADALANGGWNWSLLPNSDYTISNDTVIITPNGYHPLQFISIGKPGGY